MVNTIKSLDDALRESIDESNIAIEGFQRIRDLLKVIEHLASANGVAHITTVAKEASLIALEYGDIASTGRGTFEASRKEMLHG
ncbi:hypothetical protein [Burkholderia pseudomallei]|uniref:hypothetical protein n=1 Tax=Burkholderia pseudomallei TaxID=28450 RepID=UPI000A1A2D11|nr:hypothetical protein [Burkholderia pseudomallei]ARK98310.1 hypothetical protein BOC43_29290 [Burkholderia pseudomallei]